MIPQRRRDRETDDGRAAASTSIQDRLARLRAEQRRSAGSGGTIDSRSSPRADLLAATARTDESNDEYSALKPAVGLIPSWRQVGEGAGRTRWSCPAANSMDTIVRKRRTVIGHRQDVTSLEKFLPSSTPSLREICLRLIALDLATTMIYLDWMDGMDAHLRIELMQVASVYAPLSGQAVSMLLVGGRNEAMVSIEADAVDGVLDADEGVDQGWEASDDARFTGLSLAIPLSSFLTTLDISFSTISLAALRSLLLSSSSSAPSTTNKRYGCVNNYPNLTQLNLTHTPRIPFTAAFFHLLSCLLSIRSLSIAAKSSGSIAARTILPRLANATPSLVALDLSHTTFGRTTLEGVDFGSCWIRLKRLRLKCCGDAAMRFSSDGGMLEVEENQHEERKRIWGVIKGEGRSKAREWVDIDI